MRKMPTLFDRQFENHNIIKCLEQVHKGCEWVISGEGYATEKLDGTCCMIKGNELYRRYDYKKGKTLPLGAIPCQPDKDFITGHWPHWVLCDPYNPSDKYHLKAFSKQNSWTDGTYEGLKEYLNNHYIEGIVFYRDNGDMCKIKRTDFGFKWK